VDSSDDATPSQDLVRSVCEACGLLAAELSGKFAEQVAAGKDLVATQISLERFMVRQVVEDLRPDGEDDDDDDEDAGGISREVAWLVYVRRARLLRALLARRR